LELDLDRAEDISHDFGDHGIGPFGVPWECFIPETIDGFLPAEKNISQSRLANGATRLQPSTLLLGQAAGAIAALAVKHFVQPRQVDPILVQSVLLDNQDTLLETPLTDVARRGWEWKPIQLVAVHGLLSADKGPSDPPWPAARPRVPGSRRQRCPSQPHGVCRSLAQGFGRLACDARHRQRGL
jgi:hypothetical protein